jgi:phosphoribosylglycinamide formyltransferase-1
MKRLGILLSGTRFEFRAIADSVAAGRLDAEIAVVISNRPEAPGLAIAKERGLNAVSHPSKGLDREIYDRQVIDELHRAKVDLVVWPDTCGFSPVTSSASFRSAF